MKHVVLILAAASASLGYQEDKPIKRVRLRINHEIPYHDPRHNRKLRQLQNRMIARRARSYQ